ncbi:hypothetical protein JOC77_003509 [Peribacillus deserti]|uniref:DUF4025 domain-containing protein n=1 Tax=Peribacillus deserti TaxID=673318 RepID=A0ABS2QM27_9BACI|nr:YozQ family protein [Peribacillus deserti]MBM7694065.1 hypothetical protein [Peribacillus deserti]
MENKENKESLKLANRYYQPGDYYREDQVSNGLAITHEQVSDNYMGNESVPPESRVAPIPRNSTEERE